MSGGGRSIAFLNDGKAFDMRRTDLASQTRNIKLWELANTTDVDCPMHTSETQFQFLERERRGQLTSEQFVAWKDTVNVARGESVQLKVKYLLKDPRLYHCLFLEHEKQGIMGVLDVQ